MTTQIMDALYDSILKIFDSYDSTWIQRKRSIDTKTIFEYALRSSLYKKGTDFVLREAELDDNHESDIGLTFTPVALCKARQRLPKNTFSLLNSQIVDQHANMSRVFAIDGSKVRVPAGFHKYGYKSRTNDQEVPRKAKKSISMLSALVDVDSKVCFDYTFTKHFNERLCVLHHLEKLRDGDTIILDRGYFSADLYNKCRARGVHVVFRLKKDSFRYVKHFYQSRYQDQQISVVVAKQMIQIRLVKYFIKGKVYVLGTSLTDTPTSVLQQLYKKRWNVELCFRKLKSNLNLNYTFSLKEDTCFHNVQSRILADTISTILQSADVATYQRPTFQLARLARVIRARRKRSKTQKPKGIERNNTFTKPICQTTPRTFYGSGETSIVQVSLFVIPPSLAVCPACFCVINQSPNAVVHVTNYSQK